MYMYVGSLYYSSTACTHDRLLLALLLHVLQVMVNCYTRLISNNNVLFNPTKLYCLHFSSTKSHLTQFEVIFCRVCNLNDQVLNCGGCTWLGIGIV
jgi:hypothetical protein